jgi:CDP-glucose 4,6-dehydratase
MGAEVFGYALAPATDPALFDLARIGTLVDHRIGDIRDEQAVHDRIAEVRPDVIFHMAAQPLVRESYRTPVETIATNVMGTAHVLDAVRRLGRPCAVVIVTSDKCYDNKEWVWGYRETDPMGGHDPYSMSKGAAELVTDSFRKSFFSAPDSPVRVASARAGNVIGGGDWAVDRIMTDCVAALTAGTPLGIRNPLATRPWQHVLEPVGGYLWLGRQLLQADGQSFAQGWNFGPHADSVRPVRDLADLMITAWGSGSWEASGDPAQVKEALSLSLNIDKAYHLLHWRPSWSIEQCVAETAGWYRAWHEGSADLLRLTRDQISAYQLSAAAQKLRWASSADPA